jgi:hypothetical protein
MIRAPRGTMTTSPKSLKVSMATGLVSMLAQMASAAAEVLRVVVVGRSVVVDRAVVVVGGIVTAGGGQRRHRLLVGRRIAAGGVVQADQGASHGGDGDRHGGGKGPFVTAPVPPSALVRWPPHMAPGRSSHRQLPSSPAGARLSGPSMLPISGFDEFVYLRNFNVIISNAMIRGPLPLAGMVAIGALLSSYFHNPTSAADYCR